MCTLTDKWLSNCSHPFNSKIRSTELSLISIGGTDRNGELLNTILTHVWNKDEGTSSGSITAIGLNLSCRTGTHSKGVRRGCGWLLPLDGAIASLCSDAVCINLRLQKLTTPKIVTFDCSSFSSEILYAVCWSPIKGNCYIGLLKMIISFSLPTSSTRNLSHKNIKSFGCCKASTSVGVSDSDGVSWGGSKFHVHYSMGELNIELLLKTKSYCDIQY